MKIIYITTAIRENDYREFCKLWSRSPNPSNQNFHNKLIRAIGINNEVEVISMRPFSKKFCSVKNLKRDVIRDENIHWNYLTIKGNKFFKYFTIKQEVNNIIKNLDLENSVILTDTINPLCIKTANSISKIKNTPVIGICTDSPSNITGTSKAYTMYLLKQAAKCYGYIALTSDLNDLFNPNERKSIILEGVVDDAKKDVNQIGDKNPYFFFGGALLEKYGVYNLIQAFKNLNVPDVDLYLCGHTGDIERINEVIKGYKNIHFLGTLPVNVVLQYEINALANINPRPFNMDLDKLSIPSKTLEYLASGAPTISVKNTKLQKIFEEEVIWAKSANPEDLEQAMRKVFDLSKKERVELGKKAKKKVQEHYSLDSVNKKINEFLEFFKSEIN